MQGHVAATLVLLATAVTGSYAEATTYIPFANCRSVSANGRFYVLSERIGGPVFEETSGPVRISVHAAMPGSNPVGPLSAGLHLSPDEMSYVMSDDWKSLSRRVGDRQLGSVRLSAPPARICISECCAAICLIDWYGPNLDLISGERSCITVLSYRCGLVFKKSLEDVFGADATMFFETDSNVWWLGEAWIDESAAKLVVTSFIHMPGHANDRTLVGRRIDLITGDVDDRLDASILRALAAPGCPGFQASLEYVIDRPNPQYIDLLRDSSPNDSDRSAIALLLRVALLRNGVRVDVGDIADVAAELESGLGDSEDGVDSVVPPAVDVGRVLDFISKYEAQLR